MKTSWFHSVSPGWVDDNFASSILFGLIIGVLALFWIIRRKQNLPPGPWCLPIVGFLPFLRKDAYAQLYELSCRYGPVFSFYLGPKRVVVINSFKAAKEALTNNSIMDRPPNPPNHLLPDSNNMSVSNGTVWKEQRDFTVQMLRRLGMGKSQMEDSIMDEIQHLFGEIRKRMNKPVNLDELLLPSVSNNMVSLLIGERLDFKNTDRRFLNDMLRLMVLYFRPTRVHAYFPWLRKWMTRFEIWGYHKVDKIMNELGVFIEKQIDKHLQTFDMNSVRDYIDGYLNAIDTSKDVGSKSFSRKMLKGNVQSLIGAGSTPARAAIEWTIVSMVTYPEIQKRIQMELDSVVSRDRLPSWSDHVNLPYTMAVIMEVLRKSTIIPISMLRNCRNSSACTQCSFQYKYEANEYCEERRHGLALTVRKTVTVELLTNRTYPSTAEKVCGEDLSHLTSADTKIGGYNVPKGTIIMTNIWGIHHDPELWENPHEFRPERFIKDSKVVKPVHFMPFSYGKRKCPGEDMAFMLVFLYVSCLFHKFTIEKPAGTPTEFREDLGVARLVFPDDLHVYERI